MAWVWRALILAGDSSRLHYRIRVREIIPLRYFRSCPSHTTVQILKRAAKCRLALFPSL